MRHLFPGYFKLSKAELKEMWSKGAIALDANVLLNLYRYSEDTRKEFLKILQLFKKQLILPNQVAYEFLSHRLGVIASQEKSYGEMVDKIKEIEETFSSSRQHPFLSPELLKQLKGVFTAVETELKKSQKKYFNQIHEDPLLDQLISLFEQSVLDPLPEGTLEQICKDGEKRYANQIPPGYKDANKVSQDVARTENLEI